MSRKFLIGLVLVMVLLGIIFSILPYTVFTTQPVKTVKQDGQVYKPSPSLPWTEKARISFQAVNNSGERGWLEVREMNNEAVLYVNLSINTYEEEGYEPSELRSGTCDNPGTLVKKLTDVYEGGAESMLGMTIGELQSQLPLHVTVMRSRSNNMVIVCSDITDVPM